MRDAAKPFSPGAGRWVWVAGWLLAAAMLIAGFGGSALNQDFGDPDNAMRLVTVRDFLAGQNWFDSTQYRLNPPEGTVMHWARWIDAAIGAPIAFLTPLLGMPASETTVAFLWPLALLAMFLWLTVEVCGEIGAREGLKGEARIAGALVAALALPAIGKFAPGSFDHHNVELFLSMAAMLGLIRMGASPSAGGWAGAALGAAMATAAEGVPIVAAGALIAGLLWLVQPKVYRPGLMWLGAGLTLSTAGSFVILVPPDSWATPVCDAMSASFLGFGLAAGGVALILGGGLPPVLTQTLMRRGLAAVVLGSISVGMLWTLFPECAGGGYAALGTDMETYWLAQISETRSLAALAGDDPALILSLAGSAFAGVVAAGVYLRRRWRHAEGWIALGFLLAGWAMLSWQIRGAFFATAFAIPFGAWAAVRARQVWVADRSTFKLAGFVLATSVAAAAVWNTAAEQLQARLTPAVTLASYVERKGSAEACLQPEAFAALREIPEGIMLNHFTLGTGVLQWTQHAVMAAPYHRDADGVMAMITAMRSEPSVAQGIVTETAADYVLVCSALPETDFYARHPVDGVAPEDTLAARLESGDMPEWLAPVALTGTPLRLYRIIR